MADLRNDAEKYFLDGFCAIAAAFDLADCREWRFEPAIQRQADTLLKQLHLVFLKGEIQENRRVVAANAAANAAAKDVSFQAFLCQASRPRRTKKRAAAR